jgi:2-dehydro-3-deoxygluconokinase
MRANPIWKQGDASVRDDVDISGPLIGAIGEGLFEVGVDADDSSSPLRRGYGGDVANALVMAARMGASTRLCSRVGDDAFGRELLRFWTDEGLDVRFVGVDADAATGLYVNEATGDGHRFRYYRRASAGARVGMSDLDTGFLLGLRALHVTGVSLSISDSAADATEAAVSRARAAGAIISYSVNHRPMLEPDDERLLRLARTADVLFISAEEAGPLIHTDAADRIHAALGRSGETIVTNGALGATLVSSEMHFAIPAITVDVVDAAAAGDALAGGYLAARLRGGSAGDSLRAGIAAASLSCERFGAAASYPGRADVEKAIEEALAAVAGGSPPAAWTPEEGRTASWGP